MAGIELPSVGASSRLTGLDGLRGLVAVMVVFFHLNLLGVGWIGLSCFFVLSGFLITRVLFVDIESTGGLGETLKRFYVRRTLRVMPLYYLCLIALLVAGRLSDTVHQQTANELPYAFAYVYNIFMMTSGHQGTHLMDHLWSLSVEEQFYLVWPLVIYFVGRARLPWVLAAIMLIAPLLRWATVESWPPPLPLHWVPADKVYWANYFSTLSNLDGFAFGALLNYVRVRPKLWWIALSLAVTYLIAIPIEGAGIAAQWTYGPPLTLGYPISLPAGHQYIWGYSIIYFDCALLILAICHSSRLQMIFASPVLDWLGQRSYAIYIVHFPLLFTMEPLLHWLRGTSAADIAMLCFLPLYLTAVLLTSHGLHVGFEKPILRLKDRFSTLRPLSGAASLDATREAAAT